MPRLSRVSFDYDSTLSEGEVQIYVEDLTKRGFDIWLVSARSPIEDNKDLWETVKDLKISRDHVILTDFEYKWNFIKDIDPIVHLDDDWIEVNLINGLTKSTSIRYGLNPDWRVDIEELLKPYKDKFGYAKKPTSKVDKNDDEGYDS